VRQLISNGCRRLQDKVVVITGGGTGIGEASALACVEEGASVVVVGRRPNVIDQVVQTIEQSGGVAKAVCADVGREEDAARIVESAIGWFGHIDVLVNCAGQELVANALDTSVEWWDRVMATNLRGVYLLSRAALPVMLSRKSGVIVNVASQLAFVGARNFVAYTASKGGVINLTRSMALDHAADGVRVNALCPGAVDTPLLRRQFDGREGPQGTLEDLAALHPLGRLGRPEEIARATVFLASDDSSFMTGAMLLVDGGYTAQ
jgi:NAD(P)-dependent dehydrogenase (short-subunit alcohol dehydrogenase family)